MRRMMAGAAVGILLLAGCGKSDDSGGGDAAAPAEGAGELTLEEWIAAADEICATFNDEADAMAEPTGPDEFLELMDTMLGMAEQQNDDIRALGLPTDDGQEEVQEAIDLIEQQFEAIEAVIKDADGDAEALIEAMEDPDVNEDIDAIESDLDDIAEEIGLEECGTDSGSSDDDDDSGDDSGDDMTDDSGDDGDSGDGDDSGDDTDLPVDPSESMDFGDVGSESELVDMFIDGMTESGEISEEEARCIAEGLLEDYSLGEIVDLSSSGEPDDELTDAIIALTFDCVDIAGMMSEE